MQEKYKLPVQFNHEGNSCVGAALAVIANPVFHMKLKSTAEPAVWGLMGEVDPLH